MGDISAAFVICVLAVSLSSTSTGSATSPDSGKGVRVELEPESGSITARFIGNDQRERVAIRLPGVQLDGTPQRSFQRNGDGSFSNSKVQVRQKRLGADSTEIIWTATDGEVHDFVISIEDNSAYYGCGERFASLNHKGMILPMVSIDRPEDKGSVTYKPVPFCMSTRGYAFWLDSYGPGRFDLNATDRDHILLFYRAASLRLVVIDGPDMAAMLREYTRLSGRPRVPPAWSFAPWKSRNVHNNREEVLADAELMRRHDLPGSVIVIDSPWETGYNDFVLNERQFAEPAEMFARLRELGFHVCLWLTPFVNDQNLVDMPGIAEGPSRNFAEGEGLGHFVKRPDGRPMLASWWKGRGALVDFTKPAAVRWWHEQIDTAREWGFRAIKCDDGEGNFVQDAVFYDGTPAAEMKNRYAMLYLQAAQEYVDTRFGGDGVLFARCGFSGTQRFPFCWAGDNDASFSFENGLPSVILAGQNAALSGLSMWGHDIAGYSGTQTAELFIRWAQFGAFSPVMQAHMTSNLGPWDFGDEALRIYRTYAKLHTSLFPYIYAAAHEAAQSGMPIIRPMALAFSNDPAAASHRYQYMFGPEILVAPMYQPGTHRTVYLPRLEERREWIDYWSGAAFEGGRFVEVHAPLDRMPLFMRSGALICMLPQDVDTLIPRNAEMAADVVTADGRRVIQVWPGRRGHVSTHDGLVARTESADHRTTLTVSSSAPMRVEICRMFAAALDDAELRYDTEWKIDAETGHARKEINAGPEERVIIWRINKPREAK